MILLDAFAVLAFLRDEPAAEEVQALLEGDEDRRLTTIGVAEVIDHLVRVAGADEEDAVLDLAQLDLLRGLPVDSGRGLRAGLLRARHYHRRSRPVSLADCVAAEVARAEAAHLASADPHLLELCVEEQIPVRPLPDSTGVTWSSR